MRFHLSPAEKKIKFFFPEECRFNITLPAHTPLLHLDMPSKFQICSKTFFLTFPQTSYPLEEFKANCLKLFESEGIEKLLISTEKHQDGKGKSEEVDLNFDDFEKESSGSLDDDIYAGL